MSGPAATRLADGRLHLQHGPIDLIVEADGEKAQVEAAYGQAAVRFSAILQPMADELVRLRQPVDDYYPLFRGPVARRMARAVWPHRGTYVTPMAAVAGAVADEVLLALVRGRALVRAYVNNGGDISLHLRPGQIFTTGIVGDESNPAIDAISTVDFNSPVRGIATSGWRGRSQSLGIADAVTVLASDAAAADVAATLIANMVNADDTAIERVPACQLHDDTDLGDLPVTTSVGPMSSRSVDEALAAGACIASVMRGEGLIESALILLQGQQKVIGGSGQSKKMFGSKA